MHGVHRSLLQYFVPCSSQFEKFLMQPRPRGLLFCCCNDSWTRVHLKTKQKGIEPAWHPSVQHRGGVFKMLVIMNMRQAQPSWEGGCLSGPRMALEQGPEELLLLECASPTTDANLRLLPLQGGSSLSSRLAAHIRRRQSPCYMLLCCCSILLPWCSAASLK